MSRHINYQCLGRRSVLLVEDVEMNQYLARHVMESWGFTVMVAGNGKEAVELVQQHNYDLILMDIQMPVMDGVQATVQIRKLADSRVASLPIVALTANVSKADSDRYTEAGMNGYVAKPFEEEALFAMIAMQIEPTLDIYAGALQHASQEDGAIPDTKLYDLTMVEAIAGGDEHFVKKMIQLFLDMMPQTLDEIQVQVQSRNWVAVGKLAHKMKSTIDSMGISLLKNDIRRLEANGKSAENLEQIAPLVARIATVIQQCISQLKNDYSL